jgi:hypothetical protein
LAEARAAELEMLATSLLASQRATVETALGKGGLSQLPLYRIELAFDPETSRLRGQQQLIVTPSRPIDALHLRIPANADQANVDLHEVKRGEATLLVQERAGGRVTVQLPELAQPGAPIELSLRFSMRVPKDADPGRAVPMDQLFAQAFSLLGMMGGQSPLDMLQNPPGPNSRAATSGSSAVGDLSIDLGGIVSLVGFHPELVRELDGLPDLEPEPALGEPIWGPLANYIVTIVAPPQFEIAGTGRQIGRFPERDGRMRTTRIAAATRGFVLALGKGWKAQEAQAGEVAIRAWSSEKNAEQTRKLLDVARRAIDHYSKSFGAYPWTDFEVAAVPLGQGREALAFPGVVFASPLLTDPEVSDMLAGLVPNSTRTSDGALEFSMAHQIAHQWFRGIVGSNARLAPAVDEGAAVHAALLYVEHRRGSQAAQARQKEQIAGAYRQYRMMSGPDLPLETPLSAYASPAQIIGLLQGKAAAFHVAARKRLGKQAYLAALKRYVAAHLFKEATLDGFTFEATRPLSPGQATAFLKMSNRFLRQAHGDEDIGAPLSPQEAFGLTGLPPEFQEMLEQLFGGMGGMGGLMQLTPIPPGTSGGPDEEE